MTLNELRAWWRLNGDEGEVELLPDGYYLIYYVPDEIGMTRRETDLDPLGDTLEDVEENLRRLAHGEPPMWDVFDLNNGDKLLLTVLSLREKADW